MTEEEEEVVTPERRELENRNSKMEIIRDS